MTKSKPVLLGNAIFSGLNVITGASAAFVDVGVPIEVFGLIIVLVSAAQIGFNTYVQGLVTPQEDVAAYANSAGQVVAGPAAGPQNGTPVNVVPSREPPLAA